MKIIIIKNERYTATFFNETGRGGVERVLEGGIVISIVAAQVGI